MEALQVLIVSGVAGNYLQVTGWHEWGRPGQPLFKGSAPDTSSGPHTGYELVEALIGELCFVRDVLLADGV